MKKILYLSILLVGLLSACRSNTSGYQSPKKDTVYVKDFITYKVKVTYENGDVDTVIVKSSRDCGCEPRVHSSSGGAYFDFDPNSSNSKVLYYVRRVDILSHD